MQLFFGKGDRKMACQKDIIMKKELLPIAHIFWRKKPYEGKQSIEHRQKFKRNYSPVYMTNQLLQRAYYKTISKIIDPNAE